MPWSKVVTFTDPFPCQAALQSTSQAEILPTTRGSFRVEATQIGMNKLRMQRFEVVLPQITTLMLAPDRKISSVDVSQTEISILKREIAHLEKVLARLKGWET